jgi:hypothetical protein
MAQIPTPHPTHFRSGPGDLQAKPGAILSLPGYQAVNISKTATIPIRTSPIVPSSASRENEHDVEQRGNRRQTPKDLHALTLIRYSGARNGTKLIRGLVAETRSQSAKRSSRINLSDVSKVVSSSPALTASSACPSRSNSAMRISCRAIRSFPSATCRRAIDSRSSVCLRIIIATDC